MTVLPFTQKILTLAIGGIKVFSQGGLVITKLIRGN
jgi:hypothetical protein